MPEYNQLFMTIHSREDKDSPIVNTRIPVKNPQDAFNVWNQCDPECYGFGLAWNGKVVYSYRKTDYGHETFSYLDGKLHEHKKFYEGEDKTLIVKSNSY